MGFKKFFNLHYNKGPDYGFDTATIEEMLKYWNFEGPKETVMKLTYAFGPPKNISVYDAKWDYIQGFHGVCVKDEEIPHDFPDPHKDWLYSCRKLAVPPALYTPLAEVSGSILIDGTKGLVTARCQMLIKNAVTLGFVEDVVAGKVEPTPEEYARRIEENEIPEWYIDKLGEM